jgi:hypothetical protein
VFSKRKMISNEDFLKTFDQNNIWRENKSNIL